MIFIMGVTLFTSRVVLDKLGVVNYGIYGAVGGVVGMLGFLNGTLSTGTSRFLTFEIGTGNNDRLQKIFSTAFYTHLTLSFLIALILEIGGIWFIQNKLIIPPERMTAAILCFHLSIITTIVNITQVPYTSVIIAHENMVVYAWIGIYEAVAKLFIVYLLTIASWDKLIFYAALIALVQISVALFYRLYSCRHYFESRLKMLFDKFIFKQMIGFSGWSLLANISEVLGQQGYVVLINMFFSPAIVAAQTVGNQISGAMMQFINNFRTAINPQIIKLYAAEEYEKSRNLTLQSSIYVFDLLLLLGLPIIVLMQPILNLWLVKVPDHAVIFAQYIIIRNIIGNFAAAFYIPMMAAGKMKDNSLASVVVTMLSFVILYFLLKKGLNVMWVQYIAVLQSFMYSFIVKPFILIKKIDYPFNDIYLCILQSLKIATFPVLMSYIVYNYMDLHKISMMLMATIVIMLCVCMSSYAFMNKDSRIKLNIFIKNKIHNL